MPPDLSGLSRRVAAYIQYRPHYPPGVLEVIKAECGLNEEHVIADIGCGTGILARMFLENGNRVIGVEPNPDMRTGADYALRDYARFSSVAATAEATTLPDQSCDFATSGQAFHWFDPVQTRSEFARIIRPEGWIVLVWNLQRHSGTPFQSALDAFWKDVRYWNNDRALKYGSEEWKKGRAAQEVLEPFFRPGGYCEQWFENPLRCDLDGLNGRVFSTLPGLVPGESRFDEMLTALEQMFENYQENGTVVIEHDTLLVYGQLAK
jgi:SAM-dependent methyltransferase